MNSRRTRSRSHMSFTAEGWIYLIILAFVTVGAVLRSVNLLIIMSGMMFAPLLLNWRIGSHIIRLSTTRRQIPTRIHVGALANFQWMYGNNSRVPVWHLGIQDEIRCIQTSFDPGKKEKFPSEKTNIVFNYIPVENTEYASYRSLFMDRGIYEVGPAIVSSKAPFGLVKTWHRLHRKEQFFVAPRLGTLHPNWERRIASQVAGAESLQRKRGSDEEEFYAMRPWRSGDSLRQIHWRTTAKFQQPMVRQFDQKTNRDIAIGLELFRQRDEATSLDMVESQKIEKSLSFGATVLAKLGADVQGQVGFAVVGQECFVDCERNHNAYVARVMRQLAMAQGSSQPATVEAINQLFAQVSVGTPVFIISTREMPVESLQNQFEPARWQFVQQWMRWIHVDSEEFNQLFSVDDSGDLRSLEAMEREVSRAPA